MPKKIIGLQKNLYIRLFKRQIKKFPAYAGNMALNLEHLEQIYNIQ